MGMHKSITFDTFPKQSDNIGRSVRVCFHYDTSKTVYGSVVRDDREDPHLMIIKLNDDRYVLATECMYSYVYPKVENV
jgi:hypothetical protein